MYFESQFFSKSKKKTVLHDETWDSNETEIKSSEVMNHMQNIADGWQFAKK